MSPINGSFIAHHLSGVFCLSLEDLKLKILNDIMTNDIMTTILALQQIIVFCHYKILVLDCHKSLYSAVASNEGQALAA